MEKFEIVKAYEDFHERLISLDKVINVSELKEKIKKLETISSSENFWLDQKNAGTVINELNDLKSILGDYLDISKDISELETIIDLDDADLYLECDNLINKISIELNSFEETILLNGEYDKNPAILEIHPGAGGTESQDWALMLFRMYKRFSENRRFKFKVLDYQEASDAGIKSVTCLIEGKNAYGLLQTENGVHRLVRISPFDSNARRHTSFAGVTITPVMTSEVNININPDDLRIDTYRSSGAGGQHVNTTDSAVRITHIPTGIVVSCQNERSQIQNKEQAMKVLYSKLHELEVQNQSDKIKNITGGVTDNAFGSQIRSYVLHPYSMVKDHRTNFESSNPIKVLDGELDGFINAYLKYKAHGE